MSVAERFWSKVDPRGPIVVPELGRCWIWTGSRGTGGYGQFRMSNPRRLACAHRFVYELAVGPIPTGMNVAHACSNHACVNPDHLGLAGGAWPRSTLVLASTWGGGTISW